jgi:c-di-GMP-binding flagellar brake protein YcgR
MRDWITDRILAPSRRLDLILDLDILRDTVEVRSTIIYETVQDKRLIVSQTMPPILTSRVGQVIQATYLVKDHESGEQARYGFRTKILQFVKEYRLNRGTRVQALALGYPQSEMKQVHARLLHRVNLTLENGLTLQVQGLEPGEQLTLLDISLGGFLFSYKGYKELSVGRRLRIRLVRKRVLLNLAARVVRIFEREGSRLLFVGCRFAEPSPEETEAIRDLVHGLMRQELKSRSGLDEGGFQEDEEEQEQTDGERSGG